MEQKLWTKNFILAAAANFLIYLVYYLLMVIVAAHASSVMNASPWQAGLASSLFILGGLCARIVAGRVIQRLGDKKVLLIGLVFFLLTSLLYFPVSGIGGLLIVRFLHGLGFGFSASGSSTMAVHIIPEKKRGEGISYFALSMMLASAIGPFAGMTINQNGTFNTTLFISVGAVLACLALAPFITERRRPAAPSAPDGEPQNVKLPQPERDKSLIRSFLEPSALPLSILCTLIVFAYCSVLTFLASFADTKALLSASNWFFVVYSGFALVTRPFTGRIFDRRGENILIIPSILLFSAGMLTLALAHTGFTLLCSAALIGLGYGTFFSTANAAVIAHSPSDRVHLATATYFAFADLGVGVGPFLLGFVIPLLGYRGMYMVMAVFVFCLTGLYYLVHGRKVARKRAAENAGPASAPISAGAFAFTGGMKMLIAVVREEEERALTNALSRSGFRATKLSTTGGFLRRANATLLIGTPPDKVSQAMEIIRTSSGPRRRVAMETLGIDSELSQYADQVDLGGATVFVMNVEHFEQMA